MWTKKVVEFKVMDKKRNRCSTTYDLRKPRNNEGGKFEAMLTIIIWKVNKHDRLLKELKENGLVLNHLTGSYSKSIKQIETLMSHVVPHLFLKQPEGLASGTTTNPNNEVLVWTCVVPH